MPYAGSAIGIMHAYLFLGTFQTLPTTMHSPLFVLRLSVSHPAIIMIAMQVGGYYH